MPIYNVLLGICWLIFIVYWGVAAMSSKKTTSKPWKGFLIRALIAIVVVAIIGPGTLRGIHFTQPSSSTLGVIGVCVCAFGIAFAIWARRHLGANWGMPQAVKENPELVTTGPYTYVRHPIYSGIILAMLGSALVSGLPWLFIGIVAAIYFIYSATKEEKLMLQHFPETYPKYMKRTKMLIPFVF